MNAPAVSAVLEKSKATGIAKLILLAIAKHINYETGVCFPSNRTIAEIAGTTEKTVQRTLPALLESGELEMTGGYGTGKRREFSIDIDTSDVHIDVHNSRQNVQNSEGQMSEIMDEIRTLSTQMSEIMSEIQDIKVDIAETKVDIYKRISDIEAKIVDIQAPISIKNKEDINKVCVLDGHGNGANGNGHTQKLHSHQKGFNAINGEVYVDTSDFPKNEKVEVVHDPEFAGIMAFLAGFCDNGHNTEEAAKTAELLKRRGATREKLEKELVAKDGWFQVGKHWQFYDGIYLSSVLTMYNTSQRWRKQGSPVKNANNKPTYTPAQENEWNTASNASGPDDLTPRQKYAVGVIGGTTALKNKLVRKERETKAWFFALLKEYDEKERKV